MALFVVAEDDTRFDAWRAAAAPPGRGSAAALFLARCAACHTVRGTAAAGRLGPDLTHVASRVSLGAGILPNDAHAASRWIASSQQLKPGNLMPSFDELDGAERRALADYLLTLR